MLDESDITIVGGVLDGVTQGDGSHLVGATFILNSSSWQPIAISDDDSNFQDSDGSQTLNGAQTIDGVTYSDGSVVEAEYGLTLTDGTDTWTVVGFNVNNSSPAYGTVEGLAFIGGPGGFPPVGVPLTVTTAFEGPNFAETNYATPLCFGHGSALMTRAGYVPIHQLRVGQRVQTRDNGFQPITWIGSSAFPGIASAAPVAIAPGALGNHDTLFLSRQHRVLLTDWRAEILVGETEVLVPVHHLIGRNGIRARPTGMVNYHHLAFARHEVVLANGAWVESFFPGDIAVAAMSAMAFKEFRETVGDTEGYKTLVRPELKLFETRMICVS